MNQHARPTERPQNSPRNGKPRRGGSLAPVVLILVLLVIGALAIFLVIWDGRDAQQTLDENPPAGSVEANLEKLANWAAEPIQGWIATKGATPSDEEGKTLLAGLKDRPTLYPPTPASPEGNPEYRITNNGFEIVFPGTDGKPVVCSFSSEGAYEGATGLGTFTSEDNSVEDPLEGTPR